jgi:5-methylcytosine-specific restriction endonuclease McrA
LTEEKKEKNRERVRIWRAENREKHRAYAIKWARDHQEEVKKYKSEWKKKNPEKLKASRERYKEKNRESLRQRCKDYRKKYPDRARASVSTWQKGNVEAARAITRRHRARKRGANGTHSAQQVVARVVMFGNRCAYCLGPYEAIDHVIPLAKGGSNWPANLRPACAVCNGAKQDFDWREWVS